MGVAGAERLQIADRLLRLPGTIQPQEGRRRPKERLVAGVAVGVLAELVRFPAARQARLVILFAEVQAGEAHESLVSTAAILSRRFFEHGPALDRLASAMRRSASVQST